MLLPLIPLLTQLAHSPTEDSRQLYEAIQRGDEHAYSLFFNEHYSSVYRYVTKYGIRHEVAQDIVQQSFIYLWDHRSRINPDKSLKAYLYAAAHSRVLNSIRDNKELPSSDKDYLFEHPNLGAENNFSNEQDAESILFTSTIDKEEEIKKENDRKLLIEEAIRSLAPKRQQAFRLCYLEQFTYEETAQIMNITTKTVEHHMGLALAELREKLKNIS
jgi:RNA polymerase sigma-70 factor (ECF subfamily)